MLIVLAAAAHGSPLYPTEVQSLSGADCVPACTICHDTNLGGTGTVVQPFGLALVDRGLAGASDTTSLDDAFTALVDDQIDSDDDGTTDAEALAQGLDPSTGAALCGGAETPTFGCLSHTPTAPALGLLGLLAVALRRRR